MARENYAYWLIQEIIAREIQESFKIRGRHSKHARGHWARRQSWAAILWRAPQDGRGMRGFPATDSGDTPLTLKHIHVLGGGKRVEGSRACL